MIPSNTFKCVVWIYNVFYYKILGISSETFLLPILIEHKHKNKDQK